MSAPHDDDDPLRDLDYQQAAEEVDMVTKLFDTIFRRLGYVESTTEAEMRAKVEQLLIDDPETRELIERLGLRLRFRGLLDEE